MTWFFLVSCRRCITLKWSAPSMCYSPRASSTHGHIKAFCRQSTGTAIAHLTHMKSALCSITVMLQTPQSCLLLTMSSGSQQSGTLSELNQHTLDVLITGCAGCNLLLHNACLIQHHYKTNLFDTIINTNLLITCCAVYWQCNLFKEKATTLLYATEATSRRNKKHSIGLISSTVCLRTQDIICVL